MKTAERQITLLIGTGCLEVLPIWSKFQNILRFFKQTAKAQIRLRILDAQSDLGICCSYYYNGVLH